MDWLSNEDESKDKPRMTLAWVTRVMKVKCTELRELHQRSRCGEEHLELSVDMLILRCL